MATRPILVALSIGLIASYRHDVPTRADWKAATDHVRQNVVDGDGVTWRPLWAGGASLSSRLTCVYFIKPRQPDPRAIYACLDSRCFRIDL